MSYFPCYGFQGDVIRDHFRTLRHCDEHYILCCAILEKNVDVKVLVLDKLYFIVKEVVYLVCLDACC